MQLSSFTGFCWCCWLAILKYVACLKFLANDYVKILVILVACLVPADRDVYALTVLLIKLLIWCWLLSQQDDPQSHSSQRQISRQVGIPLMTVNRIIKNDLQLKCHKKRRYDTIRDAILTCARKPTWVSLIYRTEPTTKMWKNRKTKSRKQICSEITVNSPENLCSEYLRRRNEGLQGEGFAEKEGFKPGVKEWVGGHQIIVSMTVGR